MDKMVLANRFDGYSRIFASDHPIGIDLKAMAETLRKMPEEKFAKIIDAGYEEDSAAEDKKDKEAFLMTPHKPISQPGQPGSRSSITPGGKITPTDPSFQFGGSKMVPMSAIMTTFKPTPEQIQKLEALASPATAEVEATGAGMTADPWTKSAADHVAQNLVRDVLGMNKSICCDTGRHITKEQTMDGHKAPETKNVRPTSEDTGRALTPEQIPSIAEKLNSDMYKKSKGSIEGVTKKLATEETPDAKAAEPQEVKEKEAKKMDPEETAKKVEKMEKDKAKEEAKAKSRPEKEEEKEANVLVAEGIEFDNVMQDNIDMDSPEIKKLSSLFE